MEQKLATLYDDFSKKMASASEEINALLHEQDISIKSIRKNHHETLELKNLLEEKLRVILANYSSGDTIHLTGSDLIQKVREHINYACQQAEKAHTIAKEEKEKKKMEKDSIDFKVNDFKKQIDNIVKETQKIEAELTEVTQTLPLVLKLMSSTSHINPPKA